MSKHILQYTEIDEHAGRKDIRLPTYKSTPSEAETIFIENTELNPYRSVGKHQRTICIAEKHILCKGNRFHRCA